MTDLSFFGLQKFSPNANLLFATNFEGIALGTPNRFSSAGAWIPLEGTDTLTGFSVSDLAALPLAVRPIGGVSSNQGGYAVYAVGRGTSPSGDFPTFDQAGFDNNFGAAIAAQTVEGISTNGLNLRVKDTGTAAGFQTQIWHHLYRDLTVVGVADLFELCYEMVLTLPDFSSLTDSSSKVVALWDIKSRGTGAGQGDQRDVFGITRSTNGYDEYGAPSGTIGWYCQSDSKGDTEVAPDEFYYRYKNFSVSVPINEPFKLRIYRKRAANFSDLDSGRLRIEIKKADGSEAVLFDCTPGYADYWNTLHPNWSSVSQLTQPAMNVSKGKFGRLVQAMYLPGVYFGGKANQDVTTKTGGFRLWDGYPGVLPPPAV